jgi:hypothetical protein
MIVPLPTTANTPILSNYATNTNNPNHAVSPTQVPGTSDFHDELHQFSQIHRPKCLALVASTMHRPKCLALVTSTMSFTSSPRFTDPSAWH